jgi:hypothetical protein
MRKRDKEASMTKAKSPIEKEVDRLFRPLRKCPRGLCNNPVTGDRFVLGMRGEDSIAAQKRTACRALVARAWHAHNSPSAPPLPVNVWDIDDAKKGGGLSHLLAYFAQSVACDTWCLSGHPSFETYARGVLASPECPSFFKENNDLAVRFPPQPIYGLEAGLVYVRPAKSVRIDAVS